MIGTVVCFGKLLQNLYVALLAVGFYHFGLFGALAEDIEIGLTK